MSTRTRHALLVLAGLACACGAADAPEWSEPRHLDPRLASGAAATDELSVEPVLVRHFEVGSAAAAREQLAPFALHNLRLGEGGAGGGVVFRAADYDPARGIEHAYLELEESLEAREVNRIEVELYAYAAGSAALFWSCADGSRGRADANTRADTWQTVSFSMVGDAGWRGSLRGLRLLPCLSGPQAYELREVRFLRVDFEPGAQPSARHGGSATDAGLLGPGTDLRRAWPTDDGVALYDRCRVPEGGRLALSVNLTGVARDASERVHFVVDVRGAGRAWREVARLSAVPSEEWRDLGWRELNADLSGWSGEDVELRLRAGFDDEPGTDGSPVRGELLWGAPLVFGPRARDPRPNLILVTLDTLRADAVDADMPFLVEFAERSLSFTDAWTACNSTLPSHTTMLTGLPVPTHGVLDNVSTLAPDVRSLAQALRECGYTTAAAVSVEHLQPRWSGLGRGFDRYLEVQPGASIDGARTLAPVVRWLDELSGENARPLFLWVHLFDPHTPYGPPAEFLREYEARLVAGGGRLPARTRPQPDIGRTTATAPGGFLEGVTNAAYARHLYAAGAAYTDSLLRGFVGALEQRGLLGNSALLVTADHGESLGEHGVWYGHQRLHPEVTHVPLVLRLPMDGGVTIGAGRRATGFAGRVTTRASTLDVATTLLGLAGGGRLEPRGVDLLGLAALEAREDRRVWFVHASGEQVGCRDDRAHYWLNVREFEQLGPERREPAGREALFVLSSDPRASHDVAAQQPEMCGLYREDARRWLERAATGLQLEAELEAGQAERLRALGYTGED